jgi:hypothetical protein
MWKTNLLVICLCGAFLMVGGCTDCFCPSEPSLLEGTWSLTTEVESEFESATLTFDCRGQLTSIDLTLDTGTVVGISPSSTTSVSEGTVSIAILIDQGTINFLGVFDSTNNVINGSLNAVLVIDNVTITLPNSAATLTRLVM